MPRLLADDVGLGPADCEMRLILVDNASRDGRCAVAPVLPRDAGAEELPAASPTRPT